MIRQNILPIKGDEPTAFEVLRQQAWDCEQRVRWWKCTKRQTVGYISLVHHPIHAHLIMNRLSERIPIDNFAILKDATRNQNWFMICTPVSKASIVSHLATMLQ